MRLIVTVSACILVLLTGCGTTTGLSTHTAHGGFDNARTVEIHPHGNAVSGMIGTGIGAQWSEAQKNYVILIIAVYNQQTAITGAELNIDGEKIRLEPTAGTTDFQAGGDIMKICTKGFVTKLDTVGKIIRSRRTWLRVHTPTGTMEDPVIDGPKDSKAYHALIRFMREVNAG